AAPARFGPLQPGDRQGALHLDPHRPDARSAHLRQAGRRFPGRGGRVCPAAPARL
ncbi:MAG: hypothetical protein AVDCRST_MAG73-2010, partial [uncultured Thermomicrobiales bacterium]